METLQEESHLDSSREASEGLGHNQRRLEAHIFVSLPSTFLTSPEGEHESTASLCDFVQRHWRPDPIFDFRRLNWIKDSCSSVHRWRLEMNKDVYFWLYCFFNYIFLLQFEQYHNLMNTNSGPVLLSASAWLCTCLIYLRTSNRKLETSKLETSKLWLQNSENKIMQRVESQIAFWCATISSDSICFFNRCQDRKSQPVSKNLNVRFFASCVNAHCCHHHWVIQIRTFFVIVFIPWLKVVQQLQETDRY